jgi:ABC-type dipeptide/oligopeptide/nickel transport system permease subunit
MSRRAALVSAVVVVALVFLLLVGAQTKFDPNSIDVHWSGTPLPPCFLDSKTCAGHVLGTDNLGRDVLARLFRGGQVSLGLSLIALGFELTLGIIFGVVARYGGAILKFVIMRIGDAISCFPAWPLLVVMVILGVPTKAAFSGFALAVITAILFSPQVIRLIATVGNGRDTVRALSNQAARDLTRIIVVLATVDFVGFGIQPPTPTWGNMLTDAQEDMTVAWWAVAFPGLCLFGALLAIEIVRRRLLAGDGNRHIGPSLTHQ